MSISGSCGCGAITYQANTTPKAIVNCHCNLCRTVNGSPYSTYAAIRFNKLELKDEAANLTAFAPAEGVTKHFCKICGTPLYNLSNQYPGTCMVYLGTLIECKTSELTFNVYCESKLSWVSDLDSYPSFNQGYEKS